MKTRHKLVAAVATALVLLGVGWSVGAWRARSTDAEIRQRLLQQAVHVARTLDPQMVKELSFTAADQNAPAFQFLRQQMTALGNYMPQRGIYSLGLREGRLVFGPQSHPSGDPQGSPPGTICEKPAQEALAVFAQGQAVTIGPYAEEHGSFLSAFAPVLDPHTEAVLIVVGIDTLASDWQAALGTVRRESLAGSVLLLGLALLGAAICARWQRRHSRQAQSPALPRPDGTTIVPAGLRTSAGLLVAMGILAVVFLGVVLLRTWCWTGRHIEGTAGQQARLAVQFSKTLRDYVGRQIRPEMEKRVQPGEFFPETMSTSFVARSVLEDVRQAFPDTILRFAARHPRNPANQAMPAEETLIRYFEEHPESNLWSGTTEFFERGAKYFVCATPRRFEAGCLKCHGQPADAPAALVARYGPVAGFGRSVGEVSVDLAAIPLSASFAAARAEVARHMLIALVLCLLFLAGIAFLIGVDAQRRRHAERAVEKERNFLRLVIDTIPGFVCVKSHEGRFVMANEALAKAYGTTVAGLEGRCDTDFSPTPEQTEKYRSDEREVLASKHVKRIPEEPITYADGATHWLTTTKVPLLGEDGSCDRLLAVAMDVTERRHMEEALRASEERLRGTLEATRTVVWEGDLRDSALVETGPVAALFGLPQDAVGADRSAFLERIHPQDRDRVLAAMQPGAMGDDTYEVEYRVLLPDGGIRWIQATGRFDRDADGQAIRLRGIARDVTERKLAEQRRNELLGQLEHINQDLREFAYIVSHDLKAPLRAIRTIADWLAADYQDKLDDQGKENLRLLSGRANRMQNLIDGVLQYSRVGRTEQGTAPIDLQQLVPEIISDLGAPTHITIRIEDPLPTVEADRTRITQVFQNLLSNAIKYLDKPQGDVVIGCEADGGFWKFRVTDNGPGIAEKDYERIFKLFQTLARRDDCESTGVGLTVAKKIVEMYGGKIWVESVVGQGSTFFVTLPQSTAKVADAMLQTCAAG